MSSKLRAVGAALWAFSLACAGGEALQQEHGQAEPAPEPNEGASSAQTADGVPGAGEAAVLGNGDTPDITEGSNTNWRPLDPEPDGTTPPFSGSQPVVKPVRNGAAGTTPVSVNAAPSSPTTASAASSSGTNTGNSSASTPSPIAP